MDSFDWAFLYHALQVQSSKTPYYTNVARLPANLNKNRYRDVLPCDSHRVKIPLAENDYINASHFDYSFTNADSKPQKLRYILTQGPKKNTSADFWTMVWHHKVRNIVMLTNFIEKTFKKCVQYFPNETNKTICVEEYQFEIFCENSKCHKGFVERSLVVNLREKSSILESRNIKHYHFVGWPDCGVPESIEEFADFYFYLKENNVFTTSERGPSFASSLIGPPIIHCSAGIGRTGVMCLVDICYTLAKEGLQVNVETVTEIVRKMRKSRRGCVQNAEQLAFAARVIEELSRRDSQASKPRNLKARIYNWITNGEKADFRLLPSFRPRSSTEGSSSNMRQGTLKSKHHHTVIEDAIEDCITPSGLLTNVRYYDSFDNRNRDTSKTDVKRVLSQLNIQPQEMKSQ